MTNNDEVPSELYGQCQREFWAAEQALERLQRKLATLKGWRASLAWEAAEKANVVLGQAIWNALHLPYMPPNFRHWRDKYITNADDVL
jgi:hypothetical protein